VIWPNVELLDLVRYLVVAAVWIFAGRSLLVGLSQTELGTTGWLLCPSMTQAFVAVALGMSAAVGWPISRVAMWVWLAVTVLAGVGIIRELRVAKGSRPALPAAIRDGALVAGIAVVVPATVLLPYFVWGFGGFAVTNHPDAWSYTVFGAYLWEFPRGTQGGLAPVYQWAANLSATRFVGPAELGWLAMVTRERDTQAALGLLLMLAAFTIGSASAAVGRAVGLSNRYAFLLALGSGGGNWIANAVWVSNLDNLLALSALPALATLGLQKSATALRGKAVAVGLLSAATIYTYPEFAPVILCCGALFFINASFGWPRRTTLAAVLIAVVTAVCLVSPYANEFLAFFRTQLGSGAATTARAGEGLFGGLLDPHRRLAAVWALGSEHLEISPRIWRQNVFAVSLSGFFLVGLCRLARNRNWAAVVTFALLASGFSVFAWQRAYGYGAYKFVLLGWWLLVLAVVVGVRECGKLHPYAAGVAVIIPLATFGVSLNRAVHEVIAPPPVGIKAFRELQAVEALANGSPIAVVVANPMALHWASYFLRAAKTRLVSTSGYLAAPPFQPAMAQATPVSWRSLRLLLTDAADPGPVVEQQQWKRLWSNSQYALWDTGNVGWAVVSEIDPAYPYAANGSQLVWLGDKPTTLTATASGPGRATIHAGLALSQALPPTIAELRFKSTGDAGDGCEWTLTDRGTIVSVFLHEGNNKVTLAKTWPLAADVPVAPDANQQNPFLFALRKPILTFDQGEANQHVACPSREPRSGEQR
jgi:hypothetical protein